jgi:hypothetical protein
VIAGRSPSPYLRQAKLIRSAKAGLGEVLMRDCVPPLVHHHKPLPTRLCMAAIDTQRRPEIEAESIEVRSNIPSVRIPRIEFARIHEPPTDKSGDCRGCNASRQMVNTFRVQISAESLEPGRQQHDVRLIDLLHRKATPSPSPAHGTVGRFDLIQRAARIDLPGAE